MTVLTSTRAGYHSLSVLHCIVAGSRAVSIVYYAVHANSSHWLSSYIHFHCCVPRFEIQTDIVVDVRPIYAPNKCHLACHTNQPSLILTSDLMSVKKRGKFLPIQSEVNHPVTEFWEGFVRPDICILVPHLFELLFLPTRFYIHPLCSFSPTYS